jgi:hypothetical protein
MSYATTNAGQRLDIVKTGLVAAAAVGWGLFAYSTLSSGSQEVITHALSRVDFMR